MLLTSKSASLSDTELSISYRKRRPSEKFFGKLQERTPAVDKETISGAGSARNSGLIKMNLVGTKDECTTLVRKAWKF